MRPMLRSRPTPARALARLQRLHVGLPWTGPARAPIRDDFFRDARLKRRLIHVLDALLLVVVLSVTYAIVRVRNPPQQASSGNDVTTTATLATFARAQTWMATNLARSARIGVDATAAHQLAGTRRANIDLLSGDGTDWPSDTHILATPELRTEAAGNPAIAGALASSRPIAAFGTGAARVEVREVAAEGATALERRWRQDVTDRVAAGAGLLRNPRVQEDPAPRAVLQRGGLDLRAMVLVGLLADNTDVRIVSITSDPAEAAAGMPARRVRMSIASPARSLAATLATMPPTYRPSSVAVLPEGARQLAWPVAMAPVPSLS